jgi:hypothetical protein
METVQPSSQDVAHSALEHYPHTYGEQLGVHSLETPSELFKLLVMALLMSARIRASVALNAARALFAEGWTTARGWPTHLDRARPHAEPVGIRRYDERTATMLADTATLLLDRYRGDLRRLRTAAGPTRSRTRPAQ